MTLFVITAPSGSGKTSIMNRVKAIPSNTIKEVISDTTRPMRVGEKNGVTYHYLSDKDFEQNLKNGEYVENVEYDGYKYGIRKSSIDSVFKHSTHAYIIAEYNGYKQIKENIPDVVGIFMYMDKEKCMASMLLRGDSLEMATKRIEKYDEEMKNRNDFDYVIKNVFNKSNATINTIASIIKQY